MSAVIPNVVKTDICSLTYAFHPNFWCLNILKEWVGIWVNPQLSSIRTGITFLYILYELPDSFRLVCYYFHASPIITKSGRVSVNLELRTSKRWEINHWNCGEKTIIIYILFQIAWYVLCMCGLWNINIFCSLSTSQVHFVGEDICYLFHLFT
jgi:hypothetical protein